MSESINAKNETVTNHYAAGQHPSSDSAPTVPHLTCLAQTENSRTTNAPLTARDQRAQARFTQQHGSGTLPVAAVEAGREVESRKDPSKASEWEKLVATAALRLIDDDLRVIREEIARAKRSTDEDFEAADNLLSLPLRVRAVEKEEVALAQNGGWRRG